MSKRRRGRARQQGRRYPSGDLRRDRGIIPPEVLDHRARIVGPAHVRDERAGQALGQLVLIGLIEMHHHDAGLLLYRAWGAWQRLGEMPARNAVVSGYGERLDRGPRPDVDPAEWLRVRDRYLGAERAVGDRFAWAAIDSLVIDGIVPPRVLEDGDLGRRALAAMIGGLDALVDYFGVQRTQAA